MPMQTMAGGAVAGSKGASSAEGAAIVAFWRGVVAIPSYGLEGVVDGEGEVVGGKIEVGGVLSDKAGLLYDATNAPR